MWSFGCILYELIKYSTRPENQAITDFIGKERFLFQGTSCFPLSPVKNENGDNTNVISSNDQMNIILKGLGP